MKVNQVCVTTKHTHMHNSAVIDMFCVSRAAHPAHVD